MFISPMLSFMLITAFFHTIIFLSVVIYCSTHNFKLSLRIICSLPSWSKVRPMECCSVLSFLNSLCNSQDSTADLSNVLAKSFTTTISDFWTIKFFLWFPSWFIYSMYFSVNDSKLSFENRELISLHRCSKSLLVQFFPCNAQEISIINGCVQMFSYSFSGHSFKIFLNWS